MAWEQTRIKPTGEVEVAGNTRTGVGKEPSKSGVPKQVNYGEVSQTLWDHGALTTTPAPLLWRSRWKSIGEASDKARTSRGQRAARRNGRKALTTAQAKPHAVAVMGTSYTPEKVSLAEA